MKDLRRAFQYFRPDAPRAGASFCLLLLGVSLNALKPWPLALIVDRVLGNQPLPPLLQSAAHWDKPLLLAVLSAAILVLHLAHGAVMTAHNYLSITVGLRGLARVRNGLFARLQRLSIGFHQRTAAGDLIYRASWDACAFQTLFQQGLMTFSAAILSLIVLGSVMARVNPSLTFVAGGLAILLFPVMKLFAGKMRERTASAQGADSRLTAFVQQSIAALPLTQSCTREDFEAASFGAQAATALNQRRSQHGWELAYGFTITTIFGLGAAVVTWLGAGQVVTGQFTIGELIVFLAYLAQLYEPLNQLSQVGATVSGSLAGARRVFEILDSTDEIKDRPGAKPLPRKPAAVTLDRVSFAYDQGREVLRDISFSLPAGSSAAIIGPSGAGKTTLLYLLLRFLDPTAGAVKFDGDDLRDLRLKDVREQTAVVLQEPIILPATVAENIAYGKPSATRSEIEAAARSANASQFIEKLPAGYDTVIGDAAARLSMGERQRLNIARAFLKDAPILLLDEPASALDAESEALITASLAGLLRGRTVVMVAHRLNTIAQMDQVLVLESGRLTESGRHAALRQSGGYYARVLSGAANAAPS